MNKENLLKMAAHIRTVPQEMFDMKDFREGEKRNHVCNSVGDIIGHCTVLDDPKKIDKILIGDIDFYKWSEKFTGLNRGSEWEWCFSWKWVNVDNTPEGAALRIEWLVEKGLPYNWNLQMVGTEPLCYK